MNDKNNIEMEPQNNVTPSNGAVNEFIPREGEALPLAVEPARKDIMVTQGAMAVFTGGTFASRTVVKNIQSTVDNSNFEWTGRTLKLYLIVLGLVPSTAEVEEYRKTLTLDDVKEKLEPVEGDDGMKKALALFNPVTETQWTSVKALSLRLNKTHGGYTSEIKKTFAELESIANIKTEKAFDLIIGKRRLTLDSPGTLLSLTRWNVKDENKKLLDIRVRIKYNDLLFVSKWYALLPFDILDRLDLYGKDLPMFYPLFLHWSDVRGKKTETAYIDKEVDKEVAKLKEHKSRRATIKREIENTRERCKTMIYKQKTLEGILGSDMMEKPPYSQKEKKVTREYKGRKYETNYTKTFRKDKFTAHLRDTVASCVNMEMLLKGYVIDPKKQTDKDRATKMFPLFKKDIAKLQPSDGVCCIVRFNEDWIKQHVKDQAEPVAPPSSPPPAQGDQ